MPSTPMTITAPGTAPALSLEPLTQDHAYALYALTVGNRDNLRTWLPWVDHIKAMEDTLAFIEDAVGHMAAGKQAHWIMRVEDSAAGILSLIDITDGQGTVGYWIAASHQGRGHTTRAVQRLVQHAFQDMNLTRLRLEYLDGNEGSRRVAEKNGFVRIETIPADTTLHGKRLDRHVCMLQRPDARA